eukprot:g18894.t1
MRSKQRDWAVAHGGHTIWPCTSSLCSYLCASKVANRRRVLELGAGMGVAGLIAHKTGAAAVVMTDGDSSVIKYLNENITTNVGSAGEGKEDEAKTEFKEGDEDRPAKARVLRWGDAGEVREMMELMETGHFDMVIGADLIYPEKTKKAEWMPLMDVKIRDLMTTASAALREGGELLLAHEIRGDMAEVLALLEKHAIGKGFGAPSAVRMETAPDRVVLSLPFNGKTAGSLAAEKDDDTDNATQGWSELFMCLQATVTTADSHASGGGGSTSTSTSRKLDFLSTGLRVARVTCISCSPDKRFVVVCYKAVGEDGPNQAAAYATVYHMPTRPHASRVKTISYERPRRHQYPQQRDEFSESRSSGSSGSSRRGSENSGSSISGDVNGCKRQATPAPPTPSVSNTAEFVTSTFSHDGRIVAMLDGSPEWTLLWFEWKTGKRIFTLQLDSPVHRVALSPIDHSKTATAGADGQFKIWRTPLGGKVSPMAPIAGLREDVCYRDVAWLNGDRLVLVAHEGIVTLVSPSDVLQQWDVGLANGSDVLEACSPDSPCSSEDVAGCVAASSGTYETLTAGAYGGSINVVVTHERGFFVGGSRGEILVFEHEKALGGGGGGGSGSGSGGSESGRDGYTLTRAVRIFGVELVELRPTMGPDYRWLFAGAEDGEIGLLDIHELFSAAPDSNSLASSIDCDVRRGATTTTTGVATGVEGEEKRAPVPRLCRVHPPKAATPETQATGWTVAGAGAPAAAEVALETNSLDGGVVSRGFAKAMDEFEDSLRAAAEAELGSTGPGAASKPHHQKHAKNGGAAPAAVAKSTSSASGSSKTGATAEAKPLYRPVARGLGVGGGQPYAFHGEVGLERNRRRGALSCLAVCARKPLLAAIARGGVGLVSADGTRNDKTSNCGTAVDNDSSLGERQRQHQHQPHQPANDRSTGGAVEIQIWNYRTKRALVKHRFGRGSSSAVGGGGGAAGVGEHFGSVLDAAANDQTGSGGMGADRGGGGDGRDVTCPVAISLHPSGDSIAVAFPNYVNVFYIVGGGCGGEAGGDQSGVVVEGMVDLAASNATLSISPKHVGVAEELAATEMAPLATLRSDQREFLTKGMLSVSGEQEAVINCDPVSAVQYSPGGHLLAVVTGKIVQILGVHSSTAGGRLGRVQTLSGHASDVKSFCWGADDRRCWTAAGGYLFEWEVGAGIGALGPENTRRGEFVSKRAVFEGVVADPALDGGVVACGVFGNAAAGGNGGGRSNASKNAVRGGGRKKRSAGALSNLGDGAGGATPELVISAPAATGSSVTLENAHNRANDNNDRNRDRNNKNNNENNEKASSKRKKAAVLESASTCATTGGSMAPAAFLPRGSTAAGLQGAGGTEAVTTTDTLSPASDGDHRKSSVLVWPRKLEATSGDAGLEAKVPYRLTCVRATAFEARFKGAYNALLAGTKEGLALAFDWGCLLRESGGGGGGEQSRESKKSRPKASILTPFAQVCLHSRPITSLALTADGRHFFTAAGDGAVFMCKIQLEGRHSINAGNKSNSAGVSAAERIQTRTPLPLRSSANVIGTQRNAKMGGDVAEEGPSGAAAGGSCMAREPCVEEGMILMEEDAVGRLQAKAAAAHQQVNQVKHQARFELEKSRREQQKELAAVKEAGKMELSLAEVDMASLRRALVKGKKERDDLAKASAEQRKREASVMNAMYEKKLALQAESYMQLKIAYEELSQAATDDAEEMQAKAERAARDHENAKREHMKKVLEDHRVLKGYVDFVGAQFHKVIDDEQLGHDKQVNVLRAAEEIGEIEKSRVREEAKAEVLAAKKELRTLSKRMEQQCTREVDSMLALAAEKEKTEQLEARVNILEQEVQAKAERLSEWENMTDKQKTAVLELEKLKKALTMQLMEQRSLMKTKDELVAKTKEKLDRNAKIQNEGVRQVSILQKELSGKARLFAAAQAEVARLKASLQHREALLRGTATRVMSALDSAKEKDHWLVVKHQVEAVVMPIMKEQGLDGLDPDEAATEQSHQRLKMQESIQKMREALRHEHQNNEQQNLVRVAENLELTRELNLLRKKNTALGAEVTRLQAKIKFDKEIQVRRRQQRSARGHASSAPEFLGAPGAGVRAPVAGAFPPPLSPLRSLNTPGGGMDDADLAFAHGTAPFAGGGDEAVTEERRPLAPKPEEPNALASPEAAEGAGGCTRGDTRDFPAVSSGSAGLKRPMTGSAGHLQQQNQRLRPSSSLLAKKDAAMAGPETAGKAARPTASAWAAGSRLGRRRSGGLLAGRSDSLGRLKTKAGAPGMRVLLPGQGARDYASLLKGSATLKGRELEERVATAEAEATWLARENHRLKLDAERVVGAREADAMRAVTALTAELHRVRAEAAASTAAAAGDSIRDGVAGGHRGKKDFFAGDDSPPTTRTTNSAGLTGQSSHFEGSRASSTGGSISNNRDKSSVVAVRLPSPGNTVGYSDGLSLSTPAPFHDNEEDELFLLR